MFRTLKDDHVAVHRAHDTVDSDLAFFNLGIDTKLRAFASSTAGWRRSAWTLPTAAPIRCAGPRFPWFTAAPRTSVRCQLLLGHTELESTVRYLGIEVEDALEIAEQTEA